MKNTDKYIKEKIIELITKHTPTTTYIDAANATDEIIESTQYKPMLGEQIEHKLKELRELCKFGASKETASITFFLNSEGWNTQIQERSIDSLQGARISMKNIKGDWIK